MKSYLHKRINNHPLILRPKNNPQPPPFVVSLHSMKKIFIIAAIALFTSACSGLREHIRQRQLETHGPGRTIHDNRSHIPKDSTKISSTSNKAEYRKYSEKWNVSLNGDEDPVLLKEIDSWLGTPYVYGGESKSGTDCSGMIQTIYKSIYNVSLNRSANDMQKDVRFIDLDKARLGDVLFFKINFKTVGHVALYLGNRRFVHATVNKGVMISSLDEDYYAKRYYKCGRIMAMDK